MFENQPKGRGNLPTRNRTCTDLFCAVIFLIFTLSSIGIAFYGFLKGDLKNVVQPYDSSGNACGRDLTHHHPYLYLQSTSEAFWAAKTACVKACPTTEQSGVDCYTNEQIKQCTDLEIKPTYTFAGRFCWPKGIDMSETAKSWIRKFGQQEAYGDLVDSWRVFLVSFVVAFILSLAYLYLLEQCAFVLISICIVLFMGSLTALAVFFHMSYLDTVKEADTDTTPSKTYLYLAIVTYAIMLICLCLFCCLWSRIKLAARIIQATADYITDYKLILLVPFITTFFLILYLIWWSYSGAYLFSVGEVQYQKGYIWGEMKWNDTTT